MQLDDIRKDLEERGIKKAKIGGFDVDGVLRGKYVSLDKLYSALEKGFGFCDVIFGWDIADQLYDNAKVTGWDSGYPDAHAKLDPQTFRVLPARARHGELPRGLLRRGGQAPPRLPAQRPAQDRTRAPRPRAIAPRRPASSSSGSSRRRPRLSATRASTASTPLSPGMFGYSWLREAQHADFLHDILDTCTDYRIPLEGVHTETGPGVYEAALDYAIASRPPTAQRSSRRS